MPASQESPKDFGAEDEKTDPVGSGPYILDTGKTVVGIEVRLHEEPELLEQVPAALRQPGDQRLPADPHAGERDQGWSGQRDRTLLDNTAIDQVKASGYTVPPSELNWTVGIWLLDRDGKVRSGAASR